MLDQTRTKILSRYAVLGRTTYAQDAYFSVHSLLDLALEKIFGGCWGISDEKLPDDTINGLKGVYGRVVSGLFRMAGSRLVGELADSLQEKKRQPLRSAYERSHLEALQECAAAVLYEGNSSRGYSGFEHEFLTDFNQQIDAFLSLPSFQQTMRHARYRDPFDGIGMDDNDIISILSFRDSKFGKERVVYLRDDSDQERALKVAMLPMTHDYDGVLYAWGEEKLTKSQAKDVLIALSNDKRWNVVEKNNYLQKLLDLLPADAEVSAVITRIVSKLDPTTQADQVIETVREIATRRSGFGGCGEGEAKKLCLMPQNQEILLNLYEQALSNLEPNPNRRISSWISLRGYSESNFNPIKLALKTLTACEHIQDEKHEEDDEEDRYTFSAAQSISEVLGRILVGNKGLNDNEQETLVTALRQSLACNTSVQTRGDSYRVWRDLLSFSTREEQPVIASATLRAQVMAQFIESFEATAKKPEMVDRLDRELQRLRYGLLADVREQFLGVLEDKQRFQEVDTAVKEQWAQILREDDPWGARMLLGDDTKGDA